MTYVPTFAIVGALKQPIVLAVPTVIVLSFLIAIGLMLALKARALFSWRDFGFVKAPWPDVFLAFFIGAPLAVLLTWLDHRFGSAGGPLAGLSIPLWKSILYFVVCASIQEETIFRGLAQSATGRGISENIVVGRFQVSSATLIVAVIFGLVHFEVSVVTAVAAFVLGVVAGQLRQRSQSLIPAVIVHALFNAAALW
jgi:membrane protease YdiL (CAAX protease family)